MKQNKSIFIAITLAITLIACGENKSGVTPDKASSTNISSPENGWLSLYDSIAPMDIPDNVIKLIGEDWMLITAGNKDSFNTMTASWGAMGYVWGKPASFIFVRDSRFTYEFLQKEESFTLSFFTEEHRGALKICGSKSGRDTDKIKESGLTPVSTPSGLMTFGEARMIVECRKMYLDKIDFESMSDNYRSKFIEDWYKGEPMKHTMFISEIVNVWVKK